MDGWREREGEIGREGGREGEKMISTCVNVNINIQIFVISIILSVYVCNCKHILPRSWNFKSDEYPLKEGQFQLHFDHRIILRIPLLVVVYARHKKWHIGLEIL